MKKLILSAAIILGSLTSIHAQDQTTPTEETTVEATTITTETASSTTGFREIKIQEVPAAVINALAKSYPDALMTRAFVNEKNEYQIDIKSGDKEASLFANESGKWIQN
ncbi:hypothetical protein [Flavobacterium sp. 7A]|uniref:hypothetical protein n=1 Tax=Flavobacterium sp. 7A TaxID=2940571 RepID=UPI0022277B71|nr:hypothetical protein [Flavobacterium sp. 7A]MCW2119129.1 hypothetical protein [Flavobacterium sp. 7A]